jgi:hypothetical protein
MFTALSCPFVRSREGYDTSCWCSGRMVESLSRVQIAHFKQAFDVLDKVSPHITPHHTLITTTHAQ